MPTISNVSLQIAVGVPDPASAQVTVAYTIVNEANYISLAAFYSEDAYLWRRIQGRPDEAVIDGSMTFVTSSRLSSAKVQRFQQKIIPLKRFFDTSITQSTNSPVGYAPVKVLAGPTSPSVSIGPVYLWAVVTCMPNVPTPTISISNSLPLAAPAPKLMR